jgi:hypothetical protein
MTEREQPWNAALNRILDILASSAQPVVQDQTILYRWGQHIFDDSGDNTGQYGVHGTSEAVRALAVSIEKLGPDSRYQRFLEGGVLCLSLLLSNPKKPIDLRKTVKVGQWTAALTIGGGEKAAIDQLLQLLFTAQDTKFGGWGWDLKTSVKESILLPTLYALDGLVRVYDRFGMYSDEISIALQFCLDELKKQIPTKTSDPDTIYAWKAAFYKLCEIINIYYKSHPIDTNARNAVEELFPSSKMADAKLPGFIRFEYRYRISEQGKQQEHAFCVLPVGIMQLRTELWAKSLDLNVEIEEGAFKDRVADFIRLIYSPHGFPFNKVGSCAAAARLVANFGREIDAQVRPITNNRIESLELRGVTTMPSLPISDPFEAIESREKFYLQLMQRDDAADRPVDSVRIVKELTGGYSGAHVDLCEIITGGAPELLQVLKLDKGQAIQQETGGATEARHRIPAKYRVDLFKSYLSDDSSVGFLRYNYASYNLTLSNTRSFLEFFEAAANPDEIVTTIKEIYEKALGRVLATVTPETTSLIQLRSFFESKRGNTFWISIEDGYKRLQDAKQIASEDAFGRVILNFPFKTVHSPFINSKRARETWNQVFPGATTAFGHGDLNPRNILLVREEAEEPFVPVLIDFHRFGGPVPLPLDFARLEVGIQIKGLRDYITAAANDPDAQEFLIRYEKWINGRAGFNISPQTQRSLVTSLPAELMKTSKIIAAIRERFLARFPEKNDLRFYWGAIMFGYFSYLRPIYDNVLTTEQRLFAFYCGASIFKRHFLYP